MSTASSGMENSDGVDQDVDNDDKVGDSGKEGETADFDTDDCEGKTRGWSPGGKNKKKSGMYAKGDPSSVDRKSLPGSTVLGAMHVMHGSTPNVRISPMRNSGQFPSLISYGFVWSVSRCSNH